MANILILIVIGVAAGILSGLFGVGGGIIIVPALVFFVGMSQHTAQGTSLGLMLLPIGILAAMNYFRSGNLDVKAGLIIAVAFIVGGYVGSKIALGIEDATLKRIFGIMLLVVSIRLIFFSK
ncbi:MAG TPA: permease [Flavobacteriales bacterium]|nr:permease [Flavobacteriales bacterium]